MSDDIVGIPVRLSSFMPEDTVLVMKNDGTLRKFLLTANTVAEQEIEIARLRAEVERSDREWYAKLQAADAEVERLTREQIDPLAHLLLSNFGGPAASESACEMAQRVLVDLRDDAIHLRAGITELTVRAESAERERDRAREALSELYRRATDPDVRRGVFGALFMLQEAAKAARAVLDGDR